ncbi:hypothetical protein KY321_00760 [Candidatus Woesearchaeota archaeon]|nr:hypothetical protein [Candidatus Woesearchaeota archaeon]
MSHLTDIYDGVNEDVSKACIENPCLRYSTLTVVSHFIKGKKKTINLGLQGNYSFLDKVSKEKGLATELKSENNFSFILERAGTDRSLVMGTDYFFVNIPQYHGRPKIIKSKFSKVNFNSDSKLFACPEIGKENVGMLIGNGAFIYNSQIRKIEKLEIPGYNTSRYVTKLQDVLCMSSTLKKDDFLTMGKHKSFCSELYASLIQVISRSDVGEIPVFVSFDKKIAGVSYKLKEMLGPNFEEIESLEERLV